MSKTSLCHALRGCLLILLVSAGLLPAADVVENDWRAGAEVLTQRVERLSEAGDVDAAAAVLAVLLGRENIQETGLDDRARMALAKGYLKVRRPQQALHTLQDVSWADKSPEKAADIVSLELAIRWQGLQDQEGMLISGAIPAINAADSLCGLSGGAWEERRTNFKALLDLQHRGMRMIEAEGATTKLPASSSLFALANYAHGGVGWEPTEARIAREGWKDSLRTQAALLHLQDHEIEQAFQLAAAVWDNDANTKEDAVSEEGAMLFRRFRLWQERRRVAAPMLLLWSYLAMDKQLDALAPLYPTIAEAVKQAVDQEEDLAALVMQGTMTNAVVAEDEKPVDIVLLEEGQYRFEGEESAPCKFLVVDRYADFSVHPTKREYATIDRIDLRLRSMHRGLHTLHVYALKDRAHWELLRKTPSREHLPATPIRTHQEDFSDWHLLGEPKTIQVELAPLPEGFYVVTLTGRGSPVVFLDSFAVFEPDLNLITGESSLLVWVVNRSDGTSRAGEVVRLLVSLVRDIEEAGGTEYAEASPAWQAGFREGFTGEVSTAYREAHQDNAFLRGRNAGNEAGRKDPPLVLEEVMKTDAQGRVVLELPAGMHHRAYEAVAEIARPEVAVKSRVRHKVSRSWEDKVVAWADKPLVRPGETVRYKAVVRGFDGEFFRLPDGEVRVRLRIGNAVIQDHMVKVDETGTIHGEMVIAPGSDHGSLTLTLNEGKPIQLGVVKAIQLPRLSMEMIDTPNEMRCGEDALILLRLADQAGEPLQDVEVGVRVEAWAGGVQLPMQSPAPVRTTLAGEARFLLPTLGKPEATYRADVHVRHENETYLRRVSWRTVAFPFPLSVELHQSTVTAGGILPFLLQFPKGATVRAELESETGARMSETILLQGAGDTWTRARLRVPTDALEASKLVLRTDTLDGTEARRELRIDVRPAPRPGSGSRLSLVVLDTRIEPDQPLTLTLGTSMPGRDALVLGGTRVLRFHHVARMDTVSTSVPVTVSTNWAPNLELMAWSYTPGEGFIKTNRTHVDVLPTHKLLRVEVRPERDDYRPGETVRARVHVTDWKGNAVKHASISLGVVNDLVYQLEADPTPDLWAYFHNDRRQWTLQEGTREYLQAIRAILWKSVIRQWIPDVEGGGFGSRTGHGTGRALRRGGGSGTRGVPLVDLSRVEDNTIFWVADLRTDATGTADVLFDLPMGAARFRCTARVNDDTPGVLVGEVRKDLRAHVPFRCTLELPVFVHEGDVVPAQATLFNYQAEQTAFTVTCPDGSTRQITIPGRSRRRLPLLVTIPPAKGDLTRVGTLLGRPARFTIEMAPRQEAHLRPTTAEAASLVLVPGAMRMHSVRRVAAADGTIALPMVVPEGAAVSVRIRAWPDFGSRLQGDLERWRNGRNATLAAVAWLVHEPGKIRRERLALAWQNVGNRLPDTLIRLAAVARNESASDLRRTPDGMEGDWLHAKGRALGLTLPAPKLRGVNPSKPREAILACAVALLEGWSEGALLWATLRADLHAALDAGTEVDAERLALALDTAVIAEDTDSVERFRAALGQVEWQTDVTRVLAALHAPADALPESAEITIHNGTQVESLGAAVFAEWVGIAGAPWSVQSTPGALVELELLVRDRIPTIQNDEMPQIHFWQEGEDGFVRLPEGAPLWPGRLVLMEIRNPSSTSRYALSMTLPPILEVAPGRSVRRVLEYVPHYALTNEQIRLLQTRAESPSKDNRRQVEEHFASLRIEYQPSRTTEHAFGLPGKKDEHDMAADGVIRRDGVEIDTRLRQVSLRLPVKESRFLLLQTAHDGHAAIQDAWITREVPDEGGALEGILPAVSVRLTPGTPLRAPRQEADPGVAERLRQRLLVSTPEEYRYIQATLAEAFSARTLETVLHVLDPDEDAPLDALLRHPAAGRPDHWTTARIRAYVDSEPMRTWDADRMKPFLTSDGVILRDLLWIAGESRTNRATAIAALPSPVAPIQYEPISLRAWYARLLVLGLATEVDFARWVWGQSLERTDLLELGYPDTFDGYHRFLKDELGLELVLDETLPLWRTQRVAMETPTGTLIRERKVSRGISILGGARLGTEGFSEANLMIVEDGMQYRLARIDRRIAVLEGHDEDGEEDAEWSTF